MSLDHTDLADRMKAHEHVTRAYLPRRTNMLCRIDGRAFHSYTKHCKRPFDEGLMADMDATAIALCEEIQSVKLGYVQSDEITLWATDYDGLTTTPWFDGNVQKISSVSAAIATAEFNQLRLIRAWKEFGEGELSDVSRKMIKLDGPLAHFDSRVWTIAQLSEVANCFKWRSDDASRNSVQMLARSLYSHKECEDKSSSELQEMTWQKGQNWNDLPARYRRGRIIVKESEPHSRKMEGETVTIQYMRNVWKVKDLDDHTFEYWMELVKERAPV